MKAVIGSLLHENRTGELLELEIREGTAPCSRAYGVEQQQIESPPKAQCNRTGGLPSCSVLPYMFVSVCIVLRTYIQTKSGRSWI